MADKFTSLYEQSVEQYKKDGLLYGYRLARAFPTYKIQFVEEDSTEGRIAEFDDFFNISNLKSITVTRDMDNPTDTAIIEILDPAGILSNRKLNGSGLEGHGHSVVGEEEARNGKRLATEDKRAHALNTRLENPLTSLMLQEGTKVIVKLGYSSDPEKLETVLVGQITAVTFEGITVSLIVQSYGSELIQTMKGVDEAGQPDAKKVSSGRGPLSTLGGGFLFLPGTFWADGSTSYLFSEFLNHPECKHFGRWVPNSSNLVRNQLTKRWKWFDTPQDDNIFAPSPQDENSIFDGNMEYVISRTTIWDIFKEM